MNLKEAFRYQNVLERLMNEANSALYVSSNAMKITRTHLRSKVKPELEDEVESADETGLLDPNTIYKLMLKIVDEREKLTLAIGAAKQNLTGSIADLDAAVEANKYRQSAASAFKRLLTQKANKRVERGTGYNFNAEGTQVPYVYEIEVVSEERFDRAVIKKAITELLAKSDEVSAAIDEVMVNTKVEYNSPWPVNDTFEDIIASMETQ